MKLKLLSEFADKGLYLRIHLQCLILIFLVTEMTGFAQAQSAQVTGLRPPTQSETEWMEKSMIKTVRVLPNPVGLERINRKRRDKGLAGIEVNVVAVGEESIATSQPGIPPGMDLSSAGPAALMSVGAAALPSAVDNTSLPSFPPIRSQDSLGSCAAFSTTYYVGTHMLGLARGSNNKNNADNTNKLSPKWTYNLVNGGIDSGSWFSTIMDVMMKLGCPSWADFPYTGSPAPASNYLEWSRDPAVWRSAIANRFQQIGRVQAVDTGAGLDNLKALLANGYALLFATDVYGWQYTQISDDPSTVADNAIAGRNVCWMVKSNSSGHAMTIVGYNDDIWIDINKNGQVDVGEKGALKIVNSWGDRWNGATNGNGDGTTWIAYDALRQTSGVAGTSNANRATGYRSGFWGSEVYWITARASYTPTLLGQFTLSHAQRNQLHLRVGASPTSSTTPQNYFPTETLFGWQNGADSWPKAFRSLGGAWSIQGTSSETSGTIVMDLTEIAQSGSQRYYVSLQDSVGGFPATLSDFRLTTPSGEVLAIASSSLPRTADNSIALAYADFAIGAIPVISGPTTASGMIGQAISPLTISATNGPSSFGATNLPPGLSINTTSGVITGIPTQAGSYAVSLSASNASGVGVGTLAFTINSQQISAPIITSGVVVSGTVGQVFNYAITASNAPTGYGANGLPLGLQVNTTTGAITGTPTQAGSFNASVIASNAGGVGSRGLTITISPASVQVPVITSAATASGLSGSAFSYRLQATNSPTSFDAINLPSGLEFNSATDTISGLLPGAAQYVITLIASNAAGSGYLDLTLTVTGSNIYGPPNNDFENPIILSAQSITSSGSNIGADAQSGEPAHAGSTASGSVWWRWTAPSSGSVTIHTGGSHFDTTLAVYTGMVVSALTQVAADDDSLPNGASQLIFNASIGTTYQIAVDGFSGATGEISISMNHIPSTGVVNDVFALRSEIVGNSASIRSGNLDTTSEIGEPAHSGNVARRSVWWTWTAPSEGTVTIDTIGSDFDTVLGVYTGNAVNSLSQIAANDDGGGNSSSKVSFPIVSGTTYQIAVDGWLGTTGSIQLNLNFLSSSGQPENDAFINRSLISGNSAIISSNNTNATSEINEPLHDGKSPQRTVWWTWTAPATGTVTINTLGSSFDTILAVYLGNSILNLSNLISNDDSAGSTTSAVSFSALAGTNYQIAIDGYGGASGNISLNFNLQVNPENDNFSNRISLFGNNADTSGSNINTTAEISEPAHADNIASRSVWWTWTAPDNGAVTITTDGSSFDTVLAVYRGSALNELTQVVANDDQNTKITSSAGFYAVAGNVYQIAVDGYSGGQGLIVLGISQTPSNILYSTDFEDFPIGLGMIDGHDGWIATDDANTGSYGIFNFGGNLAAWIGYNPTPSDEVFVYRLMGFDPIDAGSPVIRFGVDITIIDSDNSNYDQFGFALYNSSNNYLAGIFFDNETMKIRSGNGSGTTVDTGTPFSNDTTYRLEVIMDFSTNRWSSTIDGVSLFSDEVMHSGGYALSFGDIDAVWKIANPGDPGDNYMVFDNYLIESNFVSETRVIALNGNLDFGEINTGLSARKNLTIKNTGTSSLTISSIEYPAGFSGAWSGGTIAAGDLKEVEVTFLPTSALSYGGVITVNSDKTDGESTIFISGIGVAPPEPERVLQGVVTSAVTGLPLAGVRVEIAGLQTTTDAAGNYRIENIPAAVTLADFDSDVRSGNAPLAVNFRNLTTRDRHLVTGALEGFSPYGNSIALVPGETRNLGFSMSPFLNADEMRLVINWGENPRDLDSHLLTPLIEGDVRHVYYSNKGEVDRSPYAQLDVDDTTSYGPETITISRFFPGVYHYYIYLYAGTGSLMTSQAVVNLYGSTGLLRTLEVPTAGAGAYWHVAAIDGTTGAIQLINQISDSSALPQTAMNGIFASAAQSVGEESMNYYWQFGDGTTSSEADPVHVYQTPGVYNVTLTATQGAEVAVKTRAEYITVTGPPPAPEIVVEEPVGANLVDGVAALAFGDSNIGSPVVKNLTVRNTGTADLSGLAVTPSGSNDFGFSALGFTTLAPGASTNFTVTFTPTAAGPRNASLQISSNDSDENPFNVTFNGNGIAVNPYDLTFVGTPYDLRVGNQVTFDLNRLLGPEETLKVGGKLPSGLKFNANTGLLSGILSGKSGIYQVSVQVLQGRSVIRTITLSITVLDFPSSLIGSFDFLMEGADSTPTGVCKILITSPNRWSATLESAGASKKISTSGTFILAEDLPIAPINAIFPGIAETPAVTVNIDIDGSTPIITGTYEGGTLRGFRIAKVGELPPATVAYNLVLNAGEQDGIDVPAGLGWMKGKVTDKGVGTFKGMLGDGTAASFTLRVSAMGQSVLWSQPYKNKNSYIGGIVTLGNLGQTIPDDEPLEDEVWWTKAADDKTLSYPDGFPGVLVTVGTSRWTAPASAAALGGMLGWTDNNKCSVMIAGAGLSNEEPQSTPASLPTEFTLDNKFALSTSQPAGVTLAAWKGKVSKTDGAMTGTLKLPSGYAAVSGILLQDEPWSSTTGCGLIKVPVPGPKGSFKTAYIVLGQ